MALQFGNEHVYTCSSVFTEDGENVRYNGVFEHVRTVVYDRTTNGPLRWKLVLSRDDNVFSIGFLGHPKDTETRVIRKTSFSNDAGVVVYSFQEDLHRSVGLRESHRFMKETLQALGLMKPSGLFSMTISGKISTFDVLKPETTATVHRGVQFLAREMSVPYNSQFVCDVRLRCGRDTFSAHKYILMARSREFYRMLDLRGELPQEQVELEIDNLQLPVFREMLHYIYHGKFSAKQLDLYFASELLRAAELYDVDSLRLEVEDYLMARTTMANIFEHAILAGEQHSDRLKAFCFQFMRLNSNEIANSSELVSLARDHPRLFAEILKELTTS